VTLNLYLMPIATNTAGERIPKYRTTLVGLIWGMYDYGNEPACLVGVLDIDAASDTSLRSNADCSGLPVNLDQVVGGAVSNTQNALERINIPGTWVAATNSWRQVLRFVGAVCQFAQRYQGLSAGGLWFTGGVTLDTTFGSLPANVQNYTRSAAQSFGFDTSGITASSTLRQIITSAGSQYLSMGLPLFLAGVDLHTG
jgi:hypothetical protein